jgi:hypothetical protein
VGELLYIRALQKDEVAVYVRNKFDKNCQVEEWFQKILEESRNIFIKGNMNMWCYAIEKN